MRDNAGLDGRQRRRTLRDVAELAQVDPSTVSRVLAGEDQRASPVTRQRIAEAVRTLDYVPHRLARGLRTGETATIAMLVPHLGDPAYFNMMAGAKAAAAESDYVVLFADTNDDEVMEIDEIDRLKGRVDGVVSTTARSGSRSLRRLGELGMPVVLLNRQAGNRLPAVIGRDDLGAGLAVTHLAELGHTRIAHVGGPLTLDPSQRRRAGYKKAMTASRLAIDPAWLVNVELGEEPAARATSSLIRLSQRRRPTAIFCSTLPTALGALSELRARGIDVPSEVSVVGFDDHPLADHLWAPLTTIRMPHVAMGRLAIQQLLRLIRHETIPARTVVDDVPILVVRGSSAPVVPAHSRPLKRAAPARVPSPSAT